MAKNYGPVLLHWDGKLTSSVDIRYDGGLTRLIKVQRDTSYTELLSKIRLITGQFCDGSERKLICKWPIEGSNFVPVGIIDNDSTQLVLSLFDITYTVYLFIQADRPTRNLSGKQATPTEVSPPSANTMLLYRQTSYNKYGCQERRLNSMQMPVQRGPCEHVSYPPQHNSYIPVLLHWGGKFTTGDDVRYAGGRTRLMKIQQYISYSELLLKIYPVTGYSRDKFDLKLTCKWPINGYNFVQVDIIDDDSTQLMIGLFDKVYTIQLFAETDQVPRQPVRNLIGGPATITEVLPSSTIITPMPASTSNNQRGCQERCLNTEGTQVQCASHKHPPLRNRDISHEHKKPSVVANVEDKKNEGQDTFDDDSEDEEAIYHSCRSFSFGDEVDYLDDFVMDDCRAGMLEYLDIPVVYPRSGRSTWLHRSFTSKEDLQREVQRWSLARRVQYTVKAPKPDVLRFKCIQRDCKWLLYAYKNTYCASSDSWSVSSYRKEHSCISRAHLENHPHCSSSFICDYIMPVFQANFTMCAREIMELMKVQFCVNITYGKAYYAMKRALKLVKGNEEPCVPPSRLDSPSVKSCAADELPDFQDEEAIEDVLSCNERSVRARTT